MGRSRQITYLAPSFVAVVLTATSVLAAAPQSAPTSGPAAASQPDRAGYELQTIEEQVNVRSRPDANSVPLMRVAAGTALHGVSADHGWHRIIPPAGTFFYVSAAHIDRTDAAEGVVSISSGTLRARVGSTVYDLDPLECEALVMLPRGTVVRIVGERGEWLKIGPPAGVWGYVRESEVVRTNAAVATRPAVGGGLASQPAGLGSRPSTAPASQPASTAASRPVDGPDLSGMWGQRLVLVEAAIDAESHRPADEQKWEALIARLRPIADQHAEPMVARLAAAWIARLQERIVQQDTARQAEDVLRKAEREQARHERELEQIRRAQSQPTSAPGFAARGILLRSLAVEPRVGTPLYKLQNPLTRAVEAYVELEPQAAVNVASLLGQYVGVQGERAANPALGADVIRVSEIVVLQIAAPSSRPTRPGP